MNPVDAVRTGADSDNCLDCKWRGTGMSDRPCYVLVFTAPYAVWECYHRGGYPHLDVAGYRAVFGDRNIRFGAYGEPVLIPYHIVRELIYASKGYTGYTHPWENPAYLEYQVFFMASTDTPAERDRAKLLGWRTFRTRLPESPVLPGEIICPASKEAGYKSSCDQCRLCNGSYAGDPRKDIVIFPHGARSQRMINTIQNLIQIGA
jgi:hypothetical protein